VYLEALQAILTEAQMIQAGAVANYIPELATADPHQTAIALCDETGAIHSVGDDTAVFTLQSCSKVFAHALALRAVGSQRLLQSVGVEPSGDRFDGIISLESRGRAHNPLINSGAICTSSLIPGNSLTEKLKTLLGGFSEFAGSVLSIDVSVFLSEREHGHRNRAIAHLLRSSGGLTGDVDEALELYFQQCAVQVTTQQLSVMAATLAFQGFNPKTKQQVLDKSHVRDVLSVMMTCGIYDASGEWMYTVGLPAKSGVGGGILAVVPGKMGIAVYSPRLDNFGTSVRGAYICERLSDRFGWHLFA
jgi:glutaminase